MNKRIFTILITLFLLIISVVTAFANQKVCLYHKTGNGKVVKIKVDSHAVKAHLNHGDELCGNGNSTNNSEENYSKNQVVKVVNATYSNGLLKLTWRGFTTDSFRICTQNEKRLVCINLEKPDSIVTTDGYVGNLSINLSAGKYKIFATGSKTDDGFTLVIKE